MRHSPRRFLIVNGADHWRASCARHVYVLSGNASLQVTSSDVGISAPLSRARKLAADIAMARDVLAGLRHA